MSTKIYGGRVLPKMDMLELIRKCRKARVPINQACAKIIQKVHGDKYSENWLRLNDRARDVKRTQQRDPLADFSFDAVFFPLKDKTLAIFYCEHDSMLEAAEKALGAKDYHYQNQVDQPDDVTEFEWEQREKDWNEALEGLNKTPAEAGLTFTFRDYSLPLPNGQFEKMLEGKPI